MILRRSVGKLGAVTLFLVIPHKTVAQTGSGTCSSPIVIPSSGGTLTGATSGASALSGTCGNATGPEKVFRWTPTASGTATIQTCGSGTNFDSVVYMRSGTCTGAEIACNDDGCANSTGLGRASNITPAVTAGHTYYIVVDGYGSGQGTFSLTVVPPGGTATTTTSPPTTTTTFTTTTTTTTTLPPPPTNLTATAAACTEVDLRWTLSTGPVSGYNVYRKASTATAFALVKQVGSAPVFPVADTTASGST